MWISICIGRVNEPIDLKAVCVVDSTAYIDVGVRVGTPTEETRRAKFLRERYRRRGIVGSGLPSKGSLPADLVYHMVTTPVMVQAIFPRHDNL